MADTEGLRDAIMSPLSGVMDQEGVHHELKAGEHGQKLDFDAIPSDSGLYRAITRVAADFIAEEFPELPQFIIGVANGTNRFALDTARHFEGQVSGAVSEKDKHDKSLQRISRVARSLITVWEPELVVVLEDTATTGSSSVQVAQQALWFGAKHVEVVNVVQRRPQLERLDENDIPYRSMITELLPSYSAEECQADGFCAQGWELIEREK